MMIYLLKVVIFHSYVSLPEGIYHGFTSFDGAADEFNIPRSDEFHGRCPYTSMSRFVEGKKIGKQFRGSYQDVWC
jgi:hypothetical protein